VLPNPDNSLAYDTEVAEVLRIEPKYAINGTQRRLISFKFPKDAEHFLDGLRKAGLPE
jgi:adenylate cyclase